MQAIVDEQKQTFNHDFERHFLDLYLKKIAETKNDPKSTYDCKSTA